MLSPSSQELLIPAIENHVLEDEGLLVTDLSVDRKPHFGTWEVEADRLGIQGHPVLREILSQTKQNTHVKDQVSFTCFESWLLDWQHQLFML